MRHITHTIVALALLSVSTLASAVITLREAAAGLERQLKSGSATSATQSFRLPLPDSTIVLLGEAKLEPLDNRRCRRTLELVHDKPFERRGLRITNLSRRSVQVGPCTNFGEAMALQANASALNIADQLGIAVAPSNTGKPVLVAQLEGSSAQPETPSTGAEVTLTVLEKAIIRDAPSKSGEKLTRADAGTRLKARRIPGNPDWFGLDGGLRFISATVVDVSDAASPTAPARGDTSRVRLRVVERAVLRNAPSFKGKKVASLAAGVERLARKVPGMSGWFELTDSESRYPLYIHESVVATEKASEKRL